MTSPLGGFPFIPLSLAILLASHGFRKKSLSPSGALAAFVVGFLMMSIRLRTFGASLIVFYLAGSRATKVGKKLKASLEEGHQEAGYRTAWQVLCNSFTAFIASVFWGAFFVEHSLASIILPGSFALEYAGDSWCPLSATPASGRSRFLIFAALGHFACCLGDTLASELGILASSPPLLITTLKRVPPGTNGGITSTGTIASVAGGAVMGLTVAVSLLLESARCRDTWPGVLVEAVAWGAGAGGFGSLIDSLMGATIQRTRYSSKTKRILQDDSVASGDAEDVKVVSGLNILTNNQINLLSSIITAVLVAYMA